jgi:dUTP pyrophosphatase
MRSLEVKILDNGFGLPLPKYETEGAAGLDLFAATKEDTKIIIPPRKAEMIPTGIAISVPSGYEAQIRPRSGLAAKNGITVLNSPGTIDSDYRGEILVMLINHSNKDFEILRGMRIAQMVISKIEQFNLISVDELDTTDRGKDGFGSTGISIKKNEE